MQLLRTNTATRVTVGPFLDKTDGVTPEVAITVTAEKLTFIVDTAGVPTLILDTAPTASGGANDMVHITGDDAGYYDLELAAADVNYLGRAKLALTDATVHCPVFHEYMIIPAMIYDALILGTDTLQSDTVQWLGTACATPTTGGVPEVDVTHVSGTAQTAGDIIADTNDIQTQIGTAGAGLTALVDLVWDEILTGATHNVANSSGKRLRLLTAQAVMSGTLPDQTGMGKTQIKLDTGASATPNIYDEALIIIDTGTAIGEGHHILYYDGVNRIAYIDDTLITQPVIGDTYQIYAVSAIDGLTGMVGAGNTASTIVFAPNASASDDYYNNQTVMIASGTGQGQRRRITDYVGATKTATVSPNWVVTPSDATTGDGVSTYILYNGTPVQVDTNNDKTGYSISGTKTTLDALNDITAANILTTALTESYAADGATATLSQLLYMIWSGVAQFSISGTTITCKKLDGTTTSMTFNLDSATSPTLRDRNP